jgi:hypothetical protein
MSSRGLRREELVPSLRREPVTSARKPTGAAIDDTNAF